MTIPPVGAELFHADDRQTKLIVALAILRTRLQECTNQRGKRKKKDILWLHVQLVRLSTVQSVYCTEHG
jgi:hypothetical protein